MMFGSFLIHWARPEVVWRLLPIFIGAALLLWYRLYKTGRAVSFLAVPMRQKQLFVHYSYAKKLLKATLYLVGIGGLIVAAMRPQWHETEQVIAQEGRDLLVALDISKSMLATDLQPDRLAFAKQKIKQLIAELSSERLGLLLFSGSTFLQCPLTTDAAAFTMFLDAIDVETISSGTTAIDQAIKEAIRVFSKMPERKNKLLIIFTDGEDFSSNLTAVKKVAKKIGLHIITVGVGTDEGAPIPLYDHKGNKKGHQLDSKGNVVISRMNEGILHRLAEDTGGLFVPITEDRRDVTQIKTFISQFEKERLEDKTIKQFDDQYHWALLLSFVCFALEWLL